MSALAKQGPVQTSQVRASMYLPVMPAASIGLLQANRASAASKSERDIGGNLQEWQEIAAGGMALAILPAGAAAVKGFLSAGADAFSVGARFG